jgi:hypothetical protein
MTEDELDDVIRKQGIRAGEGLHDEIYLWTLRWCRIHWDEPDEWIFGILLNQFKSRGRELFILKGEIRKAIPRARRYIASKDPTMVLPEGYTPLEVVEARPGPKGKVDPELQASVLAAPGLRNGSRLGKGSETPVGEILERLFGDSLVCIGRTKGFGLTQPLRKHWLERSRFIVPNPMTKPMGRTQEGNLSSRTLNNVGERWFLVVEFDGGLGFRFDDQEKLLWHLAESQRIVMVVFSGNKSWHGWFDVRGIGEREALEWFEYAIRLGADKIMWGKVQWTRLAGGINEKTGKEQKLLYFDY